MTNPERLSQNLGHEFGSGLRAVSQYTETQRLMEEAGLAAALDKTPPVGLNLRLIAEMKIIPVLREEAAHTSLKTTVLGLAIADGVPDFQRFLSTALGTAWNGLTVVDIDDTILQEVEKLKLPGVVTLCRDARATEIPATSQDLVLRDHLGNCCPPEIDREINREVAKITKPGGISIVNISTSDALLRSPGRVVLTFDQLQRDLSPEIIKALQTNIYDLSQLKKEFGAGLESLRGKLLEIEPDASFVVFGEDSDGHGEWFRTLADHERLWERDSFEILERREREGNDSHQPPLRCRRHNVILRKKRQ